MNFLLRKGCAVKLGVWIAILSLTALGLTPLPSLLSGGSADTAYAGNGGGKGGGNGGGKGGGNHGNKGGGKSAGKAGMDKKPRNTNGATASELKGLNAYHASATAFANAAPNSQVGRIAAYQAAAAATQEAAEAGETLTTAQAALDAAIATGTATQAELDALQAEVDAALSDYDAATADTDALALAEEEALLEASNGRVLSRGTLEYLREKLGLAEGADTAG